MAAPKKKHSTRKRGRPSSYSKKIANLICQRLASGESLVKICASKGMPSVPTVMSWLWKESKFQEDFLNNYTRAREQQAEILADQIISIADDDSADVIFVEGKDGSGKTAFPRLNKEFVQRSHLRVESRKWVASKLLPKKYGDKLALSGDKEAPITIEVVKFAAKDQDKTPE